MKIGLIGYGQMGKEVENIAISKGHEIVFIIDENNQDKMSPDLLSTADIAIEFTRPDAAVRNITACIKAGLPIVTGTTGWMDHLAKVQLLVEQTGGSLFYASNFSIGANLFFKLNARLAGMMGSHPEYSVRIEEIHHTRKKDAPSGTALTLAHGIIAENKNFSGWTGDLLSAGDQIPVTSIREGNVTGIHSVNYVSEQDKITIRHEAFSRKGLAAGAVCAAEYLLNHKGIHTMDDLLNDNNPV